MQIGEGFVLFVDVWLFSGAEVSGLLCVVFLGSMSCMRQSAKMLNLFWVGMFGEFSILVLIFVVDLESARVIDLDSYGHGRLSMLSGLPFGRGPCACERFFRVGLLFSACLCVVHLQCPNSVILGVCCRGSSCRFLLSMLRGVDSSEY